MRTERRFSVSIPALILGVALVAAPPAFTADAPPAAVAAQVDAPNTAFEERLEVSEVLLDVLVTDRQGDVIVGLGPGDFVVTENGRPVETTGATFYSNRRFLESADAARARQIDPGSVPEERYFIFFFHNPTGAPSEVPGLLSQEIQAGKDARRWVEQKLPTDLVAVASYDYELKIHTDFTADATRIANALDGAVRHRNPGTEWPSRIAVTESPLFATLPRGKALGDATETVYEGLTVLARAAGAVVGRKNLLYIGLGFGEPSGIGRFVPSPRFYPETKQALNDANVAVYTIDIQAGGSNLLEDSLNQVADDTGGRFFRTFTSFLTPFQEIAKETNGYYLLSYRVEHPAAAAGYQEVEVKTKNPEFRVRTREGYLRGTSAAAPAGSR